MTAKLRRLDIQVFDYFSKLGISPEVFSPLRDQADVLSWHLWRFLRSANVSAPVSRSRVIAQTKQSNTVTDKFHFIKVNPTPDFDVEKGPLDAQNIDALESLLRKATKTSFSIDWSWLEEALRAFREENFEARFVRASRRPRGTKIEIQLEERVSHRAASMDLVAYFDGSEVHRETVSQIEILALTWSGHLNKIMIEDDYVSIQGKIPTTIAAEKLSRVPHGAPRDRLEWYSWKKTLSDLNLPNIR